ncbi:MULTISPECIES: aldehyde dehydrogenase family protein [Lysinibacillus]|uniref:aldehyde dehydrogenase family protein n=1 Tax=Lysinibacillus TaxID=400634 RepID=UPI0021A73696|nr:aldehyde dehydrogenase family protein [Lysinibacillus capsici]MCT1540517.1 aldehyde dehydrogenase family protein [Lysinibacillus capsici]MCT1571541.1 aldehyde dehydrogenase family protein [Lysinibacillus capsici]MCT1648712.1 aldehyde dehydrogenase family protein [Lysinibacillus capsici]MCT1727516.1 aldehyde dehydrogenase family protein [Lysinibacillus capsici]MCT1785408.1 aldehyde dehydrogenase family protein [Lysinibacillus capsici]
MKDTKLWINGQWHDAEESYELASPYSGEVIAHVAKASIQDVEKAIEGAQQAFQSFKKTTAYERAEILYKVVDMMRQRKEELAEILALEAGKPIVAGLAEIDRTIATYQFAAEGAKQSKGETVPMDAAPGAGDRIGWTKREPLGVISAITPFNFPFNLVAHKLGPAFAVGNTVVLKPATQTPLSAIVMAEIFRDAGLPDGALQIVTGSGGELSDTLVTHPYVKKVTFTGSGKVGLKIKEKVGLRKVTLELGSNAAVIVEPSTPINKIISRCVSGAFNFAGQVCISLQRIYVHSSIIDEFTKAFVAETEKLIVGDPLEKTTDVSAMINPNEVERIREWIEEAQEQGAMIATGGVFTERTLTPTVMTNVSADMKIVCQETFAPIVSIVSYETLDDAIRLVNESDLGLNAGIYTNILSDALYAADELQAGAVIINDIPTFRVDNMPYGGVKMSGYGREGIKWAIEEMTDMKFISIKKSF